MDIEGVAAEDPEAIHTHSFGIDKGLTTEAAEKICSDLAFEGKTFT